MNVPLLRSLNHQLISPQYRTPEEVLTWMGMIQAQNFGAAKMALAMRMKCSSIEKALAKVEEALDRGTIIRTHVMRPTWQLVCAENVRWMNEISRERIRRQVDGYLKQTGTRVGEDEYAHALELMQQWLQGGVTMTSDELREAFSQHFPIDREHLVAYIWRAENSGLITSGRLRGNHSTYALMDERVPMQEPVDRKEALRRLARMYWRGHGPATLADFSWWAGLNIGEARDAFLSIVDDELVLGCGYAYHKDCRIHGKLAGTSLQLPAFDKYLIGYADRSEALPKEYERRCFTRNGIFFPVRFEAGQIVGSVRGGKETRFR